MEAYSLNVYITVECRHPYYYFYRKRNKLPIINSREHWTCKMVVQITVAGPTRGEIYFLVLNDCQSLWNLSTVKLTS